MPGSSDTQAGGTHARFIGFLIEHYASNFPLWFAPDQVRVDAEFSATPSKPVPTRCWSLAVATWKPVR